MMIESELDINVLNQSIMNKVLYFFQNVIILQNSALHLMMKQNINFELDMF